MLGALFVSILILLEIIISVGFGKALATLSGRVWMMVL
jgi:hypothetical protein